MVADANVSGQRDPSQQERLTPMLTSLNAKSVALWVCVLYTMLTVTSSGWQLIRGIEHDSNLHLLVRFAVTLIGVGALALFLGLRRRFRRAATAKAVGSAYLISLAAVLALTWRFGQLEPLHPDAYRDIIANFTVVWIAVALVVIVPPWLRDRPSSGRTPVVRSRSRHRGWSGRPAATTRSTSRGT